MRASAQARREDGTAAVHSVETRVGALLRAVIHRDVAKLHAGASYSHTWPTRPTLPAGYTENATFWVALAALVRYLSEHTGLSPCDFDSVEGRDALNAILPLVFGGEWWLDPTTGAVFQWYDLKLKGANRAAWEALWKAIL